MGNLIHRTALSDRDNRHIGITDAEAGKNHRSNPAPLDERHAWRGLEIWMMLLTSLGLWVGIFFLIRFAYYFLLRLV